MNTDEFGVHLNAANRKYGYSPKGLKIRNPGNYDWGDFKLMVLLAIEPGNPGILAVQISGVDMPRIWCHITEAGTLAELHCSFSLIQW